MNTGNADKVRLLDLIEAIESEIGQKAIRCYTPMQTGGIPATWADTSVLQQLSGDRPPTPFREGIVDYGQWYREYHGVGTKPRP